MQPVHELNWYGGWMLVLAAFLTGIFLGLYFHREDFWGGYSGFSRRIFRLGHIALAALGMMNVLFSFSAWPAPDTLTGNVASWSFLVGGNSMPGVCFLTSWRAEFRHLFFIPVTALITAVFWTLAGAPW